MSDLQAGRELDIEIAKVVMRWSAADMRLLGDLREVPNFSTDIAAAWQVFTHFENVHKLLCHSQRMSLGWTMGQPMEWACTIYATNTVKADTPELAICLAALNAVEIAMRSRV